MGPPPYKWLADELHLSGTAKVKDLLRNPLTTKSWDEFVVNTEQFIDDGQRPECRKLEVMALIAEHRKRDLNLLCTLQAGSATSDWTIHHYCARLLLDWEWAHTGTSGVLRAALEDHGEETFMDRLFGLYRAKRASLAESKQGRRTQGPIVNETGSDDSGGSLGCATDSVPAFSDQPLSLRLAWLDSPDPDNDTVKIVVQGPISFTEVKRSFESRFNLGEAHQQFANFFYPAYNITANDEQSWSLFVIELAGAVQNATRKELLVEVRTVDLQSDLRPRLASQFEKSSEECRADILRLRSDAVRSELFKTVRAMLSELGGASSCGEEDEVEPLEADDATQALQHAEVVVLKPRKEFQIPNDPAAIFRSKRQLQWLTNDRLYARDELSSSEYAMYKMIEAPRGIYMEGMREGRYLKLHQPPAVKGLTEIMTSFDGALLTDDVGLGKTIQLVATVNHYVNERRAVEDISERYAKFGPPRPMLFLVPHSLINQWAAEIKRYIAAFRVLQYYGQEQSGLDEDVIKSLKHTDALFQEADEDVASTIVLTSPETFARRHGHSAIITDHLWWNLCNALRRTIEDLKKDTFWKNLVRDKQLEFLHEYSRVTGIQPPVCPADLRGCFSFVVCDEAHKLKNEDASRGMALMIATDRASKERPRVLLATATPILNDLTDIWGLLQLLEDPAAWSSNKVIVNGASPSPDDVWDVKWGDNARIWAMRLNRQAFEKKMPRGLMMSRLRAVLSKVMIRRSYGSKVPFSNERTIADDLPKVHSRLKFLDFRSTEFDRFVSFSKTRYQNFIRTTEGGVVHMTPASFHALSLSHIFIPLAESKTLKKQKPIKAFIKAGKTAWDMLETISDEVSWFKEWVRDISGLPPKDDNMKILRCFLEWSPKLRYIADLVLDLNVLQREKILFWTHLPAEQELVKLVSQPQFD